MDLQEATFTELGSGRRRGAVASRHTSVSQCLAYVGFV
jgi:hypothetical protein